MVFLFKRKKNQNNKNFKRGNKKENKDFQF